MTISDRLCAHVAAMRWADLPAPARDAAAQVLLDAVGVMCAASGLAPEAAPFAALARAQGPGPCSILGSGDRVSPMGAALANGALAHAVDYEDAFDQAPAHPNASLVPVLLALAQLYPGINGRQLLTALAVGGDFACRLALALRQPMEQGGWYPPPIIGAFGAVAGAANLLGLTASQVKDALSLCLCQVSMPGEIKHSQRTSIRAVREAFPAQAALTAVMLARDGVAGFEAPLEGEAGFYALYAGGQFDATTLVAGLGRHFWGSQLTFKPWPSCRGTHPFIEMALALRAHRQLRADHIAGITVEIDDVQAMLVTPLARKRAPAVAIDARFSIPFTTALALVDGHVGLTSFAPARLTDPAVLALAARIEPRPVTSPPWQRGVGGAMHIDLLDGQRLATRVEAALGCPARPLGLPSLRTKFVDCLAQATHQVAPEAAARLADRLLGVSSCASVAGLIDDIAAAGQV